MALDPTPDEVLLEMVQALEDAKGNKAQAARNLGISPETFKYRLKAAAKRGLYNPPPPAAPPGMEIKSKSVSLDGGELKRETLRYGPESGPEFELTEGRVIGDSTVQVGPDGRIERQWLRHKDSDLDPRHVLRILRDEASHMAWTRFKPTPEPFGTNADLLTIYPLADLHLSLRSHANESGEEYNLDIASETFDRVSTSLVQKPPAGGTALVAYLGDWTHQNDDKNMTPTSGHILEVSNPIFKTTKVGVRLAVMHTYKVLRRHDRVIIKVIRGNHDLTAWIGLVVGLMEHFRDEPRVFVDDGEADYWFFRWGENLLGFHHGHRLKPEEMAGSMAMECRKDWGETLYRQFFHGHLHHAIQKDILGVLVQCMRTLAPPDAYHSGKYGSPRSLTAITLHKELGEISRVFENLRPIMRVAATPESLAKADANDDHNIPLCPPFGS